MEKVKILVTGGAGFIGGNFVQYLVKKYPNYEIYNLDSLTYAGELSKHKNIESNKNYHFVKADITDQNAIFSLFQVKKFDYIVHFAAESHVDRSIKDPSLFVKTNVLGTQILLEASKQINIKKFIHISTDEVYGELDFDSPLLFTEEMPLKPNNPYSASKASSDLIVRSYYETYGVPVIITRCSNNYGPYQYPEKLIPLTITRLLFDQKVPVYGDGKNIRDWIHVYDHCNALDLLLHKGKIGEIYNIGAFDEKTNLEVIYTIINTLGKSEYLIEFVPDRLGHDKRYAIDSSKLMKLGWEPLFTFEKGIMETIRWYIDNREWWEKLLDTKKN